MNRGVRFAIGMIIVGIAAPVAAGAIVPVNPEQKLQRTPPSQPTMFSGIPIPGTAADAIAANFGNCNPNKEKDGLVCTMAGSQVEQINLMGAPIKSAKLTLKPRYRDKDNVENIRTVPIDQLVYDSIDFELSNRIRCYDQPGIPHGPQKKLHQGERPSCWSGRHDFDYVRSKLAAADWVATKTSYMPDTNVILLQVWYSRKNPFYIIAFSPSNIHVANGSLEFSNKMIDEATPNGDL